jgi:hypothetical protein
LTRFEFIEGRHGIGKLDSILGSRGRCPDFLEKGMLWILGPQMVNCIVKLLVGHEEGSSVVICGRSSTKLLHQDIGHCRVF